MALLSNVKKKLIVNAGHFLPTDKGYICEKCGLNNNGTVTEGELVIEIRNELVPMLKRHLFDITSIPDDRNLAQSIAIANVAAPTLNDGLCIDIHLNSNKNDEIRGVEVYGATSAASEWVSRALSRNIAKATGIPDRGYRPHTDAFVGSLGWIVKTNAWAVVIECGFLTNEKDRALLLSKDGPKTIAKGILNGILELYGVAPIVAEKPAEDRATLIKRLTEQLNALMVEMRILLQKQLGRGKF